MIAGGTTSADQVLDYRVRCFSKELVQDVLEMCTEFSKEILDSQEYLSQDRREQELKNCIWVRTFQENVVFNGQSWHEAADTRHEPDLKILEDKLDDLIVNTTRKRKFHPRKIVSHVRRVLKTEQDLLVRLIMDLERMADLRADTSTVSKQISETMKALPSQIIKAEGFSQVVSLQPVLEDSRIHREIFSCHVKLDDLTKSRAKPVETTPSDNPSQPKTTPILKRKKPSSPSQQNLYPLRSKRKFSLEL
uniref:NSL1 component of MIS12 kinetochore complex n=1 Tax=Leptobrachium leishanense TaxID=445787 RepID=A0A8C5MG32_9ANUR